MSSEIILHRFTMKTLKDLGAGKSNSEHVIMDEANKMCDHLQRVVGSKPIEVNTYFNIIIMNILWTIVGGKRFLKESCF